MGLDYVTAEIKGDEEERRRILKKGALIAVAVVSSLYIFLNLVMVGFQRWFLQFRVTIIVVVPS